jgi:hypothetical protein
MSVDDVPLKRILIEHRWRYTAKYITNRLKRRSHGIVRLHLSLTDPIEIAIAYVVTED